MRHRHKGRQLNRNSSHRHAMFRNMTTSLVEHEMIKTTVAKAKELRRYVEPIITKAANDSVANRRYVFDRLRSDFAVGKLFTDLGPHYESRPGGYVRVLKCGYRKGDNAPMAIVQLVDRDDVVPVDRKQAAAAKSAKSAKISKPAKKTKASKEEPVTIDAAE